MEEWKEYKLSDLSDFIAGFAFKSADFGSTGFPVVKIKDIQPPFVNVNGMDKVDLSPYNINKLEKFLIFKEDFVMAMTGATIGKIGRYINEEPAYLNQRVLKFIPKDQVDAKYIYYSLLTKRFQSYINNHIDSESAQPNISANTIGKYELKVPNIQMQRKISCILKSLDDKIELNHRINENLEQQAQALFKSWFVDFEPFKDGKFVDSELGKIPEGWKVKKLGELCDSISVTHPCKEGQLIFLNTGDIENGFILNHKYMNIKDMPGQAKKSIQENDILYSEIRPINRHFAFVNFAAQEYIVSTKLMVLRANDNKSSMRLYQYLTSDNVINELQHEAESRSGTFPQIRFENIKNLKILIGSDDVEKQYTKYIENIYKIIFQYRKEITKLTQLRDTILPHLMSGELEIKDR